CVVMLFWLPESLHFMVVKGKEPAKIAHILAKVTGRPTPEQATFVLPEKQNIGNQKSALGLIFSKPFRMTTLSLWVACFTSLLVFYLLTSWFTTLLQNIGFSQAQSLQLAPMFPLGGAVGAIVIGWLMDKYHATHTVMYSYLVAAILLVLTGMNHQHTVAFAVLIFLTGAMVGGAQSALPALTASFYPVKGRATGVSWMHGIGRFGAIFGAMIGGELLRLQLDMISIFLLLAIPALITTSALFVLNVVNKRSQRQAALVSEA
ncbi:MAG: MFS transporter, partial [Neisseriaceae bacterium]|nr:MFS transporter [Neisseriaceae bacterium]